MKPKLVVRPLQASGQATASPKLRLESLTVRESKINLFFYYYYYFWIAPVKRYFDGCSRTPCLEWHSITTSSAPFISFRFRFASPRSVVNNTPTTSCTAVLKFFSSCGSPLISFFLLFLSSCCRHGKTSSSTHSVISSFHSWSPLY